MKNKILEFLENNEKAKSIKEIMTFLNLHNSFNMEEVQQELDNLVQEGIIHETKKQKYLLMKYCKSLHTGRIDVAKSGYAFLVQDNGQDDIFINKDNLNGAIDGDMALVDLFTRNGKVEGKVIKILSKSIFIF